jgi:hypothetical protein
MNIKASCRIVGKAADILLVAASHIIGLAFLAAWLGWIPMPDEKIIVFAIALSLVATRIP